MTDPPLLNSQLGEQAAQAWEAHVALLQRLVLEGELTEEGAAQLWSEQAKAMWLMAFIRERREVRRNGG